MRKFLVFVALCGLLVVAGLPAPVTAEGGLVTDPDDVAIDAGDILSATVMNETTVTVSVTVKSPENPATDTNWTQGTSGVSWLIDTNADNLDDWEVLFYADPGGLVGEVYGAGPNPACEAPTTTAAFTSGAYQVSFPNSCIGAPASLRFNVGLGYDNTPDNASDAVQEDQAPDTGWSTAIAGPPAGVDRPVSLGVVGRNDSSLYSGPGFGGGYTFLGGKLVDAPALARVAQADAGANADVLYVGTGTDNQLWARTAALGWRHLSSTGSSCRGGPGALVYSSGGEQQLVVACRGNDDALYTATAPITLGAIPVLNNWTRLGGILSAAPAISVLQPGKAVTYLVVGQDGRVYQNTGSGYTPMGWQCKGHVAFSTVNNTSWFGCRGTDNALWVAKNDSGNVFGGVFSLGGILTDAPGAAVTPNHVVFFAQGTDNAVWQRVVRNSDNVPTTGFSSNGGQIKFGVNAVSQ